MSISAARIKELQDRIPHLADDDFEALYHLSGKLLRASVRRVIKDKSAGAPIFFMTYNLFSCLYYDQIESYHKLSGTTGTKIYVLVSQEVKDMAVMYLAVRGVSQPRASVATVKKMMIAANRYYESVFTKEIFILTEELAPSVQNAIPIENTSFDFAKAVANAEAV